MAHDHHHAHDHGAKDYSRAFALGVTLNLGFVLIEAVFGFLAGSVALVADAGHNLSDVLGLLLAWGAARLSVLKPTRRRTYGFRRSSILAALLNALVLLAAVGAIVWEALQRLIEPAPVATGTVVWVAAVGIAINTGTALLFLSGRKDDLNIRGAFLHMAADAVVSLGVVVAALGIMATGWLWLDPLTGLVIAVVITLGTWGLLREAVDLALDAVPSGIDREAVERFLSGLPGVQEVHDLHIWAMSTTETALTAHLVRPGPADDALLAEAAHELHARFGIDHTTLQVEAGDRSCHLAPAHVI
jgi:cobalt-zinc-cadmium efflux system protein